MSDPGRRRFSARGRPRALLLALLVPLLALILSGCALQFRGAGVIPSADSGPNARAHFTVDFRLLFYNDLGGYGILRSAYNDPSARVSFTTREAEFAFSIEGFFDNCMSAPAVPYRSRVSSALGDGYLSILACDNGLRDDYVSVVINSGPLAGYSNDGATISGDYRAG